MQALLQIIHCYEVSITIPDNATLEEQDSIIKEAVETGQEAVWEMLKDGSSSELTWESTEVTDNDGNELYSTMS